MTIRVCDLCQMREIDGRPVWASGAFAKPSEVKTKVCVIPMRQGKDMTPCLVPNAKVDSKQDWCQRALYTETDEGEYEL